MVRIADGVSAPSYPCGRRRRRGMRLFGGSGWSRRTPRSRPWSWTRSMRYPFSSSSPTTLPGTRSRQRAAQRRPAARRPDVVAPAGAVVGGQRRAPSTRIVALERNRGVSMYGGFRTGCFDTLRRKRAVGSGETSGGARRSLAGGGECCPMHGAPLPVGRSSAALMCPSRTRPLAVRRPRPPAPHWLVRVVRPRPTFTSPMRHLRTRPRCYDRRAGFSDIGVFHHGLATNPHRKGRHYATSVCR